MTELQIVTEKPKSNKGLLQSMFDSYGILVDNPFAFTLFIVGLLCIIAELNNSFGPLEIVSNALLHYCQNSTSPLVPVAKLLLQIVNWIIPIKINFFICFFFLIPAIIKPDASNWITSILFCFLAIFTKLSVVELFFFSQFYFMYCFVEDKWYKFLILFLSFIVFIIGFSAFTSMVGLA